MKDLLAEDNLIIFCLFVNTNHQQFQYSLQFTIGLFSEKQNAYRNFQLEKLTYRRGRFRARGNDCSRLEQELVKWLSS